MSWRLKARHGLANCNKMPNDDGCTVPVLDSIGFPPAHNPHSMHAHVVMVVTILASGEKQVRARASSKVHTSMLLSVEREREQCSLWYTRSAWCPSCVVFPHGSKSWYTSQAIHSENR